MFDTKDVEIISNAVRGIASPSTKTPTSPQDRKLTLKIIDCVLSMNRDYTYYVQPRLDAFEDMYPEATSASDLRVVITSFPTPSQFMVDVLRCKDNRRAETLLGVTLWLERVAGKGTPDEQYERVRRWAINAYPVDYSYLNIKGFGLAAFQRLRIVLGANTVKSDIHVRRFVQRHLGRKVSDVFAVTLLEHVAAKENVNLQELNSEIWKHESLKSLKSLQTL
jgi:hypothetical protein